MDLIVTSTLQNNTNLKWQIPHAGGSFPSILDRFLPIFGVLEAGEGLILGRLGESVWWDKLVLPWIS